MLEVLKERKILIPKWDEFGGGSLHESFADHKLMLVKSGWYNAVIARTLDDGTARKISYFKGLNKL